MFVGFIVTCYQHRRRLYLKLRVVKKKSEDFYYFLKPPVDKVKKKMFIYRKE